MKKNILLLLCLFITFAVVAQKQQGLVRTIERPGQKSEGIKGATVKINGYPNALVSGKGGKFSFSIPGKKQGDRCYVTNVDKKGYTMVDKLPSFAYSANTPVEIVMVSNKQLQQDEKKIRDKATEKAEQTFKKRRAEIEKQLQEKTISEEKWRELYQQAINGRKNFESMIDSMARKYAMTDYKCLSEINRQIQECIENAEFERADSLIKSKGDFFQREHELKLKKDTLNQIDKVRILAQQDYEKKLNDLAQDYYNRHLSFAVRFQNDSAAYYLMRRAALDSTNFKWQNDAGLFFEKYLANYPLAKEYFQRCLNQAVIQYGEQSELTAKFYINIGKVYLEQGDFTMALEYFQKALIFREQIYGMDHQDVAESYNNIGVVYINNANYAKGLECLQKALSIQEQVLGTNHRMVASSYNNIGEFYCRLGDYVKALEYEQNALTIREQVFDPNHPDVANSYNNIGGVYMLQGNYAKGLDYFQKALSIQEQVLGSSHPDVARTYNNIGQIYFYQNDFAKSLEYHQKALAIQEHFFGTFHPDVATSYNNIGAIYFSLGDLTTGLEYFKKALAVRERYFGTNHPDVATSYNNIGAFYYRQGDYAQALEYLKKLLAMPEEYLGPNLQAVKNNAEFCQYQLDFQQAYKNGDYAKALDYCKKELAKSEPYSGPQLQSIQTNYYKCKYLLALKSGKLKDFFNEYCFTETIVEGDTPARQQGMSGEYILLEFENWDETSPVSLYDKTKELQGKPKDIVVLKDGIITKHHFENSIGAQLGIKQITKEERKQINQLYKQWKKDQKN